MKKNRIMPVKKRGGVGEVVAAAILLAILFSTITIYFISIQTGQTTRGQAEVEAVDFYNDKLTESFTLRTLENLTDFAGGTGRIGLTVNNTGPIAMNAVYMIVYNKTTSEILAEQDLASSSPSGNGITINAGLSTQINTDYLANNSLTYRVDVISERGNKASAIWPPPPSPLSEIDFSKITEFTTASTIASGLGAVQLDFKAFGLILPDRVDRDGVDQTGWVVDTGKATGYPAFRVPEGNATDRAYLTIRVRNVSPSGENMTLLHDTGLVVNLARDQNAQQNMAIFLCNSTESNPTVSVGAYDESVPNRTITLEYANSTNFTEKWYNMIFCDIDQVRGTVNFLPEWFAELPNNSIPINPSFLVLRSEFTESHRQYGQTIPYQGVTITSGAFLSCLKIDNQAYASCAADQFDKYKASNFSVVNNNGTTVYVKPTGGTGPYTVDWVYHDGSYRNLALNQPLDGNGNIPIQIPPTNRTGGTIQSGHYIIQVLDFDYNAYYMTFRVGEKTTNDPPVAVDDFISTWEDIPIISYNVIANGDYDPDGDSPLLVRKLTDPANGIVTVNPDGTINYTPNPNWPGPQDQFTYELDDKDGGISFPPATVTINVEAVNDPPVLPLLGSKNIAEQSTLTFSATATDVESPPETLTYSLTGAVPAGASIDSATGVFTWTPTEAQGPSTYTFNVRVEDDGTPTTAFDENPVTVIVGEVNLPPVLSSTIPSQTIDEQQTLSFTAPSATDPDIPANTLAYSLTGAVPAGASIDSATGVFTWTPTEAQGPSTYTFNVRVSDNGNPVLFDEEPVTITVGEVNESPSTPVLNPNPPSTIMAGQTLTFTANAPDPDLPPNTITYSLINGPAGATIDSVTGQFSWTPAQTGTYTFTIKATDGSLSADKTLTITVVTSVFLTPVSGPAGIEVTVTGSGYDPNSLLTIEYDGSAQTAVTTTSTGDIPSGTVFTVPTSSQGAHTVTATDASSNSASTTFTLTSPILLLNPTSGPLGTSFTMTGSNYAPNSFTTVTFDGTTEATFTTTASGSIPAGISFLVASSPVGPHSVVATDSYSNMGTATFTVTVPTLSLNPNTGPVGQTVTITGSGYAPNSPTTITYDGPTVASFTTTSAGAIPSGITFAVPSSEFGGHTVTATDSFTNTRSTTFSVSPSISISPINGPTGTLVAVIGSGFAANSLTIVAFNGVTQATVTTTSTGSIPSGTTFTVPISTTGAKTVLVTDASSNSASSTFTVIAPTMTINPNSGPAGTVVTVTGTGYVPNSLTSINYNGITQATVTTTSTGSIPSGTTFTVPASSVGPHSVAVTDSSSNTATATFTVIAPTMILSPTHGKVGDTVTVTGSGYAPNSITTVTFNGLTRVTFTTTSSGAIPSGTTFTVPSFPNGQYNVIATDSYSNTASRTFKIP